MTIQRSKDRIKQTGEVFTPLPLVDEILDKLPLEVFTDPTKTHLDPAAGDGNFLVRVIAYKIANGSTAEQALSTTYGVDIMPDNVSHARGRLLTHAYVAETYFPNKLMPHLSTEDEREFGLEDGHDEFARQYNHIVKHNIVCANSLTEWDFENWKRKQTIDDLIE